MAYPDPKIVTVAAPTNEINATRPAREHPHAQRRASKPASSSAEAVNSLDEGQRVELELGQGQKGPQATAVRAI